MKTKLEKRPGSALGDVRAPMVRLRDLLMDSLSLRSLQNLWPWVTSRSMWDENERGTKRDAARAPAKSTEETSSKRVRSAPVALVGAGPGSSDLITLRGVRRIQEADVIYYDRLIDPELLQLARRDARLVYVGKAPGCHSWPQDKINSFLVAAAKQGQRVVRLKSGDPGVFARGAEEAQALCAHGIDVEIVPGVTAASAAAAAIGGFLTERGRNDTLVLTTAHKADHSTPPGWIQHLSCGARVAVYMGVSKASEILNLLEMAGLSDKTDVEIVAHAETTQQKVTRCKAPMLATVIERDRITNPAILFFSIHESLADEDMSFEWGKVEAHCETRVP
ncbi:uroporphyrinogen-III C-methyltransferase [Tropicibacter sp. Alg240-R139]|uniref:uroporphyrinogen-III C-methyltransferase n=1 Tax=Tropicibacter sp. Alg240-R139 TaxID=2305991 RepID=UPI0013E04F04|nr:uroporphyrinogen-III C-methyltransferase [Tropicibacter sp. Alg240-R139]